MADTPAAAGLTVQQWDDKFFMEYLEQNRFKSVMGTNENAIIQVKEDLTKKKGDKITYALVNRLTGAGVTGSATLEGNEEALDSRSHFVTVDKLRNAVRVSEMEEQKSAISLRNAGRSTLKDWIMENMRDAIIDQFNAINGVLFAAASEVQKDAWLVDNLDRVLYGAALSNRVAGDSSASLLNIDNTLDQLTTGTLSLMKRVAQTASPKIRPVRTTEDERWFIVYAGSLPFRDLKADTTITQAQREALPRSQTSNPLWSGGDLTWDGMIIKEIPDIPVVAGAGAGGIDVAHVAFCGAQSVGLAWAKRTTSVTEEFDYGDKHGVAIEEIRGIEKLTFGSGAGDTDDLKDHGIGSLWVAAVGDA